MGDDSFSRSLYLLEKIRGIAQEGLAYSNNPYDYERYEELLFIASSKYGEIFGIPSKKIVNMFKKDLGVVTPKIGVVAAIFSDVGKLLLVRRSDDGLYGLPGGWAQLCERPEESIRREVLEETGYHISVKEIINIISCLPGEYERPHTSYFILFHCGIDGGSIKNSRETNEVGFFFIDKISAWHKDHFEHASAAMRFLNK
ncbi:MAG: NUDIX domain-containing protein [Anaerolineaceae bacterium]|nr:MAG: NUDIX domain-containing protein [Anaerolineaceae bacterium]